MLLQCRVSFRGLLVVGLALLWLMLEPAAEPLKLARKLVDGALLAPAGESQRVDPLEELPLYMQRPLSEYRHLFRHSKSFDRADLPYKLEELERVPVAAVLRVSESVFVHASPRNANPLSEIYIADYRAKLGKLQSWVKQTELGEYATLGELNSALQTRVTLPFIDQSVSTPTLLAFAAMAILTIQAYLVSLIATASKLLSIDNAVEMRSWMPLHDHPFGLLLSSLTLIVPSALWVSQQTLVPLLRSDWQPGLLVYGTDMVLAAAAFGTWRRVLLFRRQVLSCCRPSPALQLVSPGPLKEIAA